MSLLDKQEIQDTALRGRKWSGFIHDVNERQKIRHYRARSTEERRRRRRRRKKKKKKNAKSLFFTSRGAYIKLRYIAMLYTHSIGNQP